MLYLHETIDIEGAGQDAYIAAVLQRAAHSESAGISRLVGCWRAVGSTGRWPQVVNLWEMDGWAHWADGLERQFVPARRDAHLGPWWGQAAQWRRGGFDRILVPAEGCPTHAELVAAGHRAWVCEQAILRPRAGCVEAALDAVTGSLLPLLARQGLESFGVYAAPMRAGEIVVMTTAPRFADLCAWYERRDGDPGWCRWHKATLDVLAASATTWLVPAEGTLSWAG